MSHLAATPNAVVQTTLRAELRALIASRRQRLAGAVNAELTSLYWSVGELRHPIERKAFEHTRDKIKVMTMKVSKGREFPVVALPGVGYMPAKGEDEQEAARVFSVAATRAMQQSVIGGVRMGGWGAVGISEWQSGFARHPPIPISTC